jgi:mRNA interferase YafQ
MSTFRLEFTRKFEKDTDEYYRRGGTEERLEWVLSLLVEGNPLPASVRDHQLKGKMREWRELHVEDDWLLVYRHDGKCLVVTCLWLVTHKKLRERGKKGA